MFHARSSCEPAKIETEVSHHTSKTGVSHHTRSVFLFFIPAPCEPPKTRQKPLNGTGVSYHISSGFFFVFSCPLTLRGRDRTPSPPLQRTTSRTLAGKPSALRCKTSHPLPIPWPQPSHPRIATPFRPDTLCSGSPWVRFCSDFEGVTAGVMEKTTTC